MFKTPALLAVSLLILDKTYAQEDAADAIAAAGDAASGAVDDAADAASGAIADAADAVSDVSGDAADAISGAADAVSDAADAASDAIDGATDKAKDLVDEATGLKSSYESYDYSQNGADWPEKFPKCGYSNQSPIDLPASGIAVITAAEDNFQKLYTNQEGEIEIKFKDGITTEVSIINEGQDLQAFTSNYAVNNLGAALKYDGKVIKFKHQSEHTIEGERYDLELQVVHLATEVLHGVTHSAIGTLFSVKDYTAILQDSQIAIIDTFFDSLEWADQEDPKVAAVPFGDLMMMIDTNNRWVYKGSVPNPPCSKYVYWNILKTIYPIKQDHVDLFKAQLARTEGLDVTGNWRITTKIDTHNPAIIEEKSANAGGNQWDYSSNGADWPEKYPDCARPQQSPINLLTPFSEYGQAYDIYDAAVDNLVFSYFDLIKPQINLDRNSKQVNFFVDHQYGYQGFSSQISKDVFESMAKWDAYEFKIHAPSEHTIDGKQFDIEIQILHKPHNADAGKAAEAAEEVVVEVEEAAPAAGGHRRRMQSEEGTEEEEGPGDYYMTTLGLLFDVEDYDEISDEDAAVFEEFFLSLSLEIDDPVVDTVAIGTMMSTVNMEDRWMYKGSRTVPPCNQYILWAVLEQVYPVKQDMVDLMVNKMNKVGASEGNFRVVQQGFNPDVAFVSSGAFKLAGAISAMVLAVAAYF